MNGTPKISIVTTTLNQAHFLEETIESVLCQEYPNLEYLIIDNGSSDETQSIIRKYENSLHYWNSKEYSTHGVALNDGFSRTTGEVMAWLNGDDKYLPWTFHVVAEIFSAFPHVNWIVGFNSWWNDKGVLTTAKRMPKNIYDFLLGDFCWIQQESVFWRRTIWEKAGGYINEDYRLMVDGELWSRYFLHDVLYAVDCILGGYRVHADNKAKRHMKACIEEMHNAVSDMKPKCPAEVLKRAKTFQKIRLLKHLYPFKLLRINKIARRLCPSMYEAAQNPFIHYHDGHWVESKLPFSLD